MGVHTAHRPPVRIVAHLQHVHPAAEASPLEGQPAERHKAGKHKSTAHLGAKEEQTIPQTLTPVFISSMGSQGDPENQTSGNVFDLV